MTIQEIRDEIMTEIGGDSSDTTLLANILSFIKSGLRRFPLYTRSRLLLTTKYATVTANTQSISMPSDFLSEREIYRLEDGNRIRIHRTELKDFNDDYASDNSGELYQYRIFNDILEFDKKAEEDTVVYVDYFKEVDNVALADTFFGSSDLVELCKDFAKSYYFEYEEDYDKSNHHSTKALDGLKKIERRYLVNEVPDHIEEY